MQEALSILIADVPDRPFLSIVAPAYNEHAVIGRFIESVRAEIDRPGLLRGRRSSWTTAARTTR